MESEVVDAYAWTPVRGYNVFPVNWKYMVVKNHFLPFPAGLSAKCSDHYVSKWIRMTPLSKEMWRGCVESSDIKPVAARQTIISRDSIHFSYFMTAFHAKTHLKTFIQNVFSLLHWLNGFDPIFSKEEQRCLHIRMCHKTGLNQITPYWSAIWVSAQCLHIYVCALCVLARVSCIELSFLPHQPWNWYVSFRVRTSCVSGSPRSDRWHSHFFRVNGVCWKYRKTTHYILYGFHNL